MLAPRWSQLPAPSGSMRTQAPSSRVALGDGACARSEGAAAAGNRKAASARRCLMSLLLPWRAAALRRGRGSLEERRALLVIGIARQPLPRLIRGGQAVVPILVRVRRSEDRRIGPGERDREDRAALQQAISLDEPRPLRAVSTARYGGDPMLCVEANGVD